jgi:crossover junction endodeoxyribonuclease RuvC
MIVLGLDPGLSGAYALVAEDSTIVAVDDLPVHQAQHGRNAVKRHELDLHSLKLVLRQHAIAHAFIERVTARPGQGVTSMFRFGQASGCLYGLAVGLGLPVTFVTPQAWQKHHGVGPSPDAARQRAVQLFPASAQEFARRRNGNRADAVLIASHGRSQLLQETVQQQRPHPVQGQLVDASIAS